MELARINVCYSVVQAETIYPGVKVVLKAIRVNMVR